jgi:hypothetical protein
VENVERATKLGSTARSSKRSGDAPNAGKERCWSSRKRAAALIENRQSPAWRLSTILGERDVLLLLARRRRRATPPIRFREGGRSSR